MMWKIGLHTLMIFIKNWMYLKVEDIVWYSWFTNKGIIFYLVYLIVILSQEMKFITYEIMKFITYKLVMLTNSM